MLFEDMHRVVQDRIQFKHFSPDGGGGEFGVPEGGRVATLISIKSQIFGGTFLSSGGNSE